MYHFNEEVNDNVSKNSVILPKDISQDIYSGRKLGRNSTTQKQELDNSSFSMKNDKWQDHLEKNYKATGTRTNMQDIQLPKKMNQNKINLSKKEVKLPTKHHLDIKTEARNIANAIMNENKNGVKQRKWVETSTESDSIRGKILIDDLNETKINYVVQSNKKTLKNANDFISSNGYDNSLAYIQSKMSSKDISLNDVAIAERVLQEAINHKDVKVTQDLLMDISIIGTELGQKVQALSMIQKLTLEGQLLMFQKLIQRSKAQGDKTFDNVEITPKMVENILSIKNEDGSFDTDLQNQKVEEFKRDIANQLKSTIGEKITDWRYLSMLGNSKTHIRNIVSNVAMSGTIKVKNAMARTLETVLPVKDRTKMFKRISEDVKNFTNKTVLEMRDIIQGEAKYGEKQSIINTKWCQFSKTHLYIDIINERVKTINCFDFPSKKYDIISSW